jgi:4-hydroxy-3-methylbut-2-enyl diphosphate reductase
MEIKVAQNIGFCWGVKRALDITFKTLEDNKDKIYSLGQVIHNPQMSEKLSHLGLKIIKDINEIETGRLLIRSHGVSPDLIKNTSQCGIDVVDATCPFVKHIQSLIKRLREEGYHIIIIGESEHPEVKGLIGYAQNQAVVINSVSQIEEHILGKNKKWGVVAQSTQSQENFHKIVAKLIEENFLELRILFTICQETLKRESLTQELAKSCDLMLVVGGFNSANTRRLKEISESCGTRTFQTEHAGQIELKWFESVNSVGVVSGTSTPEWVVDEIISKLKNLHAEVKQGA